MTPSSDMNHISQTQMENINMKYFRNRPSLSSDNKKVFYYGKQGQNPQMF